VSRFGSQGKSINKPAQFYKILMFFHSQAEIYSLNTNPPGTQFDPDFI